ncbi:DNA polymerase III, delta prime subunit [Aliiroseovarius halocynthiae]|uniref:DNA polymerase III subunit delta n=1 Tax=Aliiroseovarius halocynthiae TaxID=985055 RepID=A0A545SUS4_9RHOB|nr:DNA polymerase III subunit delta' [Aliiroseovarius halocynthiae]TQV68715.1 DNA polymerase III subunit delta' [Aliiroseovarius halocynthiae]SMR71136.1 DNA polymerase III, delta prime subunit [Aliiroseovarius halocynthiae]
MSSAQDDIPQPDKIEGAPHPREAVRLIGQDAAEQSFLTAFNSDRMHHGWLISGPRGVGKATLAWRIARFLLATPADDGGMFAAPAPDTLDISPDHPVAHRIAALSEPGLFLLRRPWDEKAKRLKNEITVDEVRKLKSFFALSSAGGGRRVVIVDVADEMNTNAANALLKLLEEPPEGAVLLLISHQPSRLLPTIRSRCRELRLPPLAPDALSQVMAGLEETPSADEVLRLNELAAGSAGDALRLLHLNGLGTYADLVQIFQSRDFDRPRALKLAESAVGKANADRFALILQLFDLFLARLARHGAGFHPAAEAAPGEAACLARLSPNPHAARAWASLQQELSARAGHGRAVNLDPAALILDMVFRINDTAGKLAA